jgi:hypothetical protein
MVTKSGPLWPGHTNYIRADVLLKESKFDIVISGDNHQSFHTKTKNGLLINSGPILRATKTERDFNPRVGLVEINEDNSFSFEWVPIPIEPSSSVFKSESELKTFDTSDKEMKEISAFIDSLQGQEMEKVDFLADLDSSLNRIENPGVLNFINIVKNRINVGRKKNVDGSL